MVDIKGVNFKNMFCDSLVSLTLSKSKMATKYRQYNVYRVAGKWYISSSEKDRNKIKADLEMLWHNLENVRGIFFRILQMDFS